MKLVTTWFGTFLMDHEDLIVQRSLFPSSPGEIAARLQSMEDGNVLQEEADLAAVGPVLVREKRLATLGDVMDFPQPDISPSEMGVDPMLLGRAMLLKGRAKVKAQSSPDEQMVQAIRAMDDLAKIINLMSERLHEWHALNFPELSSMAPESRYIDLIAVHGSREAMQEAGQMKLEESLGADITESDARAVQSLACSIQAMTAEKQEVERYIESRMREIAPNMSHLAGPLIGARLISLTGGLDRLSKLPSSTMQLLGAEKALFKHIKENARPPKHGVIFQHPLIHRSPPWQRGKIARALAAKLTIAARLDRHGGRFMGPQLEENLNRRVEEIRRKHPKPKPRPGGKGRNAKRK